MKPRLLRVLRLLLLLYPPGFRRRYAPEMLELLEHQVRGRRERGELGAVVRYTWLLLVDTIKALPDAYTVAILQRLQIRRDVSPSRRLSLVERSRLMFNDLRSAVRSLSRNPSCTTPAIVALALGIGANTAVFSVYHSVLLDPLPYHEPDRLVQIWEANPEAYASGQLAYTDLGVNPLNYIDYRDQSNAFSSMGFLVNYSDDGTVTVGGDGDVPERIGAWSVSGSIFEVLGVSPVVGRTFLETERAPADYRTGRWIDVAIISSELWQRRFASDTGIVGRRIMVDGASATVIGVLPPGFQLPPLSQWGSVEFHDADLYLPLHYPAFEMDRRFHQLGVIARLKENVGLEEARAELRTIAERLEAAYPETNTGWIAEASPLRSLLVRDFGSELTILMCAAGLVLLIACSNVANLQLAQGVARKREMATRAALGAGRAGLFRQLLVESLLLAALGGLAGLLVAYWGTESLVALVPGDLPRAPEAGIDLPVFAFTFLVTILAGVVFGLVPAVRASRVSISTALKAGIHPEPSGRPKRLVAQRLVPGQVALAVVLLIGSCLLLKSFVRLNRVERGYDPSRLLVARIHAGAHHPILGAVVPGQPEYETRTRAQADVFREILWRVRSLPGVESAATTTLLPLQGGVGFWPLQIEATPDERRYTRRAEVGTDYFRTMNIPLLRGEMLSERHYSPDGTSAVVVSETLARIQWPGEDPVGKRIGFWDCCDLTVIGVVGDVDDRGVDDPPFNSQVDPRAVVYAPVLGGDLLIRTANRPERIAEEVRSIYSSLLNGFTLEFNNLEGLHSASLARPRFYMVLVGAFAAVAMVLAIVGLYGVIAHSVSQRTCEVGVRMALGADGSNVREMVVKEALLPVVLGITVGISAAFALNRSFATLLYGMPAVDVLTYLGVVVTLFATAACASYLPARRASLVDPMQALRYE